MASYCLVVASLLTLCTAIAPHQYCGDAVQSVVSSFTFNGTGPDEYTANYCSNQLGVLSMAAGVKTYCSTDEVQPGWDLLTGYCTSDGLDLTPWADILPSLTNDFISSLPVVEFADIAEAVVQNSSILISRDLWRTSYRTTEVFDTEYIRHKQYGWAMYGFWGLVLLGAMISRALSRRSFGPEDSAVDIESSAPAVRRDGSKRGTTSWLQAHLILPAAFGNHHRRTVWACSIPTRLNTIIVVAFYVLNFVLCCVTYKIFYPNIYYTEPIQLWRYISDRCGIISYANLPWLWLFAGRNNIFIPLTGIEYSTFNIFHRHIARVATIQAIVHSVGYTVIEVSYDELASSWKEEYWYMGGLATITMSLLLGLSSYWLRRHWYEFFLLVHIVFAALTIVALFYHTKIFDGEYDGYLRPLVAIWLFDRGARVARLVYCNVYIKSSKSPKTVPASVSYDMASSLLTVNVAVPRTTALRLRPGQHFYIYQPAWFKFWENHPFTLATWSSLSAAASKDDSAPSSSSQTAEKCTETVVRPTDEVATPTLSTSSGDHETLTFLVRPYTAGSFTSRLRAACLTSPAPHFSIERTLLLEGPYTTSHRLHQYSNLIFILGGSGITAAMSYLLEWAAHHKEVSHKWHRVQSVTIVFSARQVAMLETITDGHLASLRSIPQVKWELYCTSPSSLSILASKDKEIGASISAEVSGNISPNGSGVQLATNGLVTDVKHTRPDISAIIAAAAASAAETPGRDLGVFVCGPPGMADSARSAVVGVLKTRDGPANSVEVEYFEEAFGW